MTRWMVMKKICADYRFYVAVTWLFLLVIMYLVIKDHDLYMKLYLASVPLWTVAVAAACELESLKEKHGANFVGKAFTGIAGQSKYNPTNTVTIIYCEKCGRPICNPYVILSEELCACVEKPNA